MTTTPRPEGHTPGHKIKRRGVSLYIRQTRKNWQVMRGNKILSRHESESGADVALSKARGETP